MKIIARTIVEIREGTIRTERRDVLVREGQPPRVKLYADTHKGIVACYMQTDRAPAAGAKVMLENVSWEAEDGTTGDGWQIG